MMTCKHGMAKMLLVLHLVLKPHRENLQAGTTAPQKIFALLKVIPDAQVSHLRAPLALALVIDTSGSMRDVARNAGGSMTKLDCAIEAAQSLLQHEDLTADDLITIIQYDDEARTLLPLSPLGDGQAARDVWTQLRGYSGGTHMAKGLAAALHELRDIGTHAAQRVLVLTDGQASDETECRALAQQLAEMNAPVISIGIGDDYNEELLRDVAEIGRGRPYHLQNVEHLGDVLGIEVRTSAREVVTNLQIEVKTVKGVALESITRVYPSLAEITLETPCALGNIAAGDYTVFTLEICVAGLMRPAGRARLAQVQLSATAPGLDKRATSPLHDITVAFTPDEAAVTDVDEEVLGYVQQRNTDRMLQQAARQLKSDTPGARRTLQTALGLTQHIGNAALTHIIEDSLQELARTGTLSAGARKTLALGGRTRTVRATSSSALKGLPSEEEIRKLTGS